MVRFAEPKWENDLRGRYPELPFASAPDLAWVDPDDPEVRFSFLTAELVWTASAYDQLLLDIANYDVPPMVFFSSSRGFVYAPYDGGADVIAPREADLPRLRANWSEWISTHAEGL